MVKALPDLLPRRFGDYLLFDKIGEGGMARIYLSRHSSRLGVERLVAVKQILPFLSDSAEFSRLLIEEAKLAARLTHGNVVQVYDLGKADGLLFIAMEYVEGFDLNQVLRRCSSSGTGLPVEFSLFVVCEMLKGLSYAHNCKDEDGEPLFLVHRDVSPSNVLLSFDGAVKLCDFGIARAIGAKDELGPQTVQGKASYMSPEAAAGLGLDARADLFSAGIVLWELLSGRRLYKGRRGQPPSLDQAIAAEIPELTPRGYPDEARLFAISRRALAKSPEDRYATVAEFLNELEEYVYRAGLMASPLRFGSWLRETFGGEILTLRRTRERAARALARGPLVEFRAARTPVERQSERASEQPAAAAVERQVPERQANGVPEPQAADTAEQPAAAAVERRSALDRVQRPIWAMSWAVAVVALLFTAALVWALI